MSGPGTPSGATGGAGVAEADLFIRNQLGLHARACALFVKTAARFAAEVYVRRDDLEVNGKSIMGVLMLAAEQGSWLRLAAHGHDAPQALDALADLVGRGFEEA